MLFNKSYSDVINMSEEMFRVELQHLTLGETLTLKNFLILIWERTVKMKDALIQKHNSSDTSEEEKNKIAKTIQGMLSKMMVLELKVCLLKDREAVLLENRI